MTVAYLFVSAFLAAWSYQVATMTKRWPVHLAASTLHIVFIAMSVGAGIQLFFKG